MSGGNGSLSAEGKSFTSAASIVTNDETNDLASLRIDTPLTPLPPAPKANVGMWVAAFGSPHGVAGTVTFGTIANVLDSEQLVMTDAAINHGNSGGPLVNSAGQVVGINNLPRGGDVHRWLRGALVCFVLSRPRLLIKVCITPTLPA